MLRRVALGGLACAVAWPRAVHAVISVNYFVFFDFKSTEITPLGLLTMTHFLNAYRSRGDGTQVAISGYTDAAEASEALAQARGEVVRDRIVALGVPANRIQIFAYGGNRLLVKTPPNTPEPNNRYAELWFPNWR